MSIPRDYAEPPPRDRGGRRPSDHTDIYRLERAPDLLGRSVEPEKVSFGDHIFIANCQIIAQFSSS